MGVTPNEFERRLLVLIIAHNEGETIADVVGRVKAVTPEASILVVNDGSADGTGRIARRAGSMVVEHAFNLGIGAAAQTGQLYALRGGFDVMVRVDGDGQHPPEQIPQLLEAMERENANMVIASRFVNEKTSYCPPFLRRCGIRFFACGVSFLCRQRLTDTTSGFYAADRAACAYLASMYVFDYPEVQSIVSLSKAGMRIVEVPCEMVHRKTGRSSITFIRSMYYVAKVSLAVLATLAAPATHADARR